MQKKRQSQRVKSIFVCVCRLVYRKQDTEEMRKDKKKLSELGRWKMEYVNNLSSSDPWPISEQVNLQTNLMKSTGGLKTPTQVRPMHPDWNTSKTIHISATVAKHPYLFFNKLLKHMHVCALLQK